MLPHGDAGRRPGRRAAALPHGRRQPAHDDQARRDPLPRQPASTSRCAWASRSASSPTAPSVAGLAAAGRRPPGRGDAPAVSAAAPTAHEAAPLPERGTRVLLDGLPGGPWTTVVEGLSDGTLTLDAAAARRSRSCRCPLRRRFVGGLHLPRDPLRGRRRAGRRPRRPTGVRRLRWPACIGDGPPPAAPRRGARAGAPDRPGAASAAAADGDLDRRDHREPVGRRGAAARGPRDRGRRAAADHRCSAAATPARSTSPAASCAATASTPASAPSGWRSPSSTCPAPTRTAWCGSSSSASASCAAAPSGVA